MRTDLIRQSAPRLPWLKLAGFVLAPYAAIAAAILWLAVADNTIEALKMAPAWLAIATVLSALAALVVTIRWPAGYVLLALAMVVLEAGVAVLVSILILAREAAGA